MTSDDVVEQHIYCPQCEYMPLEGDLWACDCGHEWNTFATRARCPACDARYEVTACPRCHAVSAHEEWYHEKPPIPFLHRCENCARPIDVTRLPQPDERRSQVMRYMSVFKYGKLLRDGALYLTRLDRFEDKFEGSLPRPTVAAIERGEALQDSFLRDESDRRHWARQYYVSCWHMADEESDAMWRLYCGQDGGVCLVSTYDRLSQMQVGGRVLLGAVRYVDYETADFDWNDDAPIAHKRKAFAYEREVRIVSPHVCNLLLMSREQARSYLAGQP